MLTPPDFPPRYRTVANDRFDGPPRHVRIGGLRDLIDDILAEPSSHTVVAVFGVIAGCLGTVGFAFMWSLAA